MYYSITFTIPRLQDHTRELRFQSRQRADLVRGYLASRDPRYNPSDVEQKEAHSNLIIVHPASRFVDHDTSELAHVGTMVPLRSNDPMDERSWFCAPEHLDALRQTFDDDLNMPTQAMAAKGLSKVLSEAKPTKINQIINRATNWASKQDPANRVANTRLSLKYSCGSAKSHMDVVLPGAITDQQIQTITSNLIDGHQLVAPQVNLPSPLENAIDEGDIPGYDETDHPLTNLADWEDGTPSAIQLHTTDEPTANINVSDLTKLVSTTVWDQLTEMDRLGLPDYEDLDDAPGMY